MSVPIVRHTQGPWTVTEAFDRIYGGSLIRAQDAKTGDPVAVICDFNRYDRDAERDANARLIAAAPLLLEAAVKVVRASEDGNFQTLGEAVRAARAAIAATTGEPS